MELYIREELEEGRLVWDTLHYIILEAFLMYSWKVENGCTYIFFSIACIQVLDFMFYWVVGLVGGFCAQNMYSKDDIHVHTKK